jgi:DNA-binding CsgD family transcriptional regulator
MGQTARTVEIAQRTLACLRYVSHGLTYEQAGEAMHVSAETVRQHMARARIELGAKTKTQACCTALRLGLID